MFLVMGGVIVSVSSDRNADATYEAFHGGFNRLVQGPCRVVGAVGHATPQHFATPSSKI